MDYITTELWQGLVYHAVVSNGLEKIKEIKVWIKNYSVKVSNDDMQFLQKTAGEQEAKKIVWTTEWITDPDNLRTYAVIKTPLL